MKVPSRRRFVGEVLLTLALTIGDGPSISRAGADPYRAVACWSGRLLLPAETARRPDGGVTIEIENAPAEHADLIGRRAWLTLAPPLRSRFARTVTAVTFDAGTRRQEKRGDHPPRRIEGWAEVGPLESLAGARDADDLRVSLEAVTVVRGPGTLLEIAEFPTQICGSRVGLVKLRSLAPDSSFTVQHYDPETRSFDGPAEVLETTPDLDPKIRKVLPGLLSSPMGRDGWFIRGAPGSGRFVLESLEPAMLFAPSVDEVRRGDEAVARYIDEENWNDTPGKAGRSWKALVSPSAGGAPSLEGEPGERHLLIHNFGGLGGPGGDGKGGINIAGGHMAYGIARVVIDPFRGSRRLEVVYNQVYGNNPERIVSGRVAWHDFMGSLARGWLYRRAVSDAVIRLPLLDRSIDVGDGRIRFLDELMTHLDVITALYRTGFGSGSALITPHNNCSQDSARALHETVSALRDIDSPRTTEGLLLDPELAALNSLSREIHRWLLPGGQTPSAWDSRGLTGVRRPVTNVAGLLLSRRTVMPRFHAEGIVRLLLERGADALFLRTNSLSRPGLEPHPIPPRRVFPVVFERPGWGEEADADPALSPPAEESW